MNFIKINGAWSVFSLYPVTAGSRLKVRRREGTISKVTASTDSRRYHNGWVCEIEEAGTRGVFVRIAQLERQVAALQEVIWALPDQPSKSWFGRLLDSRSKKK